MGADALQRNSVPCEGQTNPRKAVPVRPHSHTPILPHILIAALLLAPLAGCVERSILLRSDPPGAAIVLNGVSVGATPVEVPFKTYGAYEVVLSAPRHQRLRQVVRIDAPWYQQIVIDFFAEHLWPFRIHDRHEISLALSPMGPLDEPALQKREEELRLRTEAGMPMEIPAPPASDAVEGR